MTTKTIIAPGFYTAKPTAWGIKTVGEKNTLVAYVTLAIIGGEHDGIEVSYNGYLTDKTLTRTLEALAVMGFTDTTLDRFNEGAFAGALNATKSVRIRIKEEEYNGKTYTKVAGIYAPRDGVAQAAVSKAMLPNISGAMMALKAEGKVGAAKAQAVAAGGADDLPF